MMATHTVARDAAELNAIWEGRRKGLGEKESGWIHISELWRAGRAWCVVIDGTRGKTSKLGGGGIVSERDVRGGGQQVPRREVVIPISTIQLHVESD